MNTDVSFAHLKISFHWREFSTVSQLSALLAFTAKCGVLTNQWTWLYEAFEVFYNSLFSCQIMAESWAKNSAKSGSRTLDPRHCILGPSTIYWTAWHLSNCARSPLLVWLFHQCSIDFSIILSVPLQVQSPTKSIAPRLINSDINLTSNGDLAQLDRRQAVQYTVLGPLIQSLGSKVRHQLFAEFFCSGFCHDLAGKG